MFVFFHAVSGEEGKVNRFFGFCRRFEDADFFPELFGVGFRNGECMERKFGFAQMDDLVAAVNDQINLGGFV